MVTAVTNLGRSGLYDWLFQRITAVVLLAWCIWLAALLISRPDLSYAEWQALFQTTWLRVFSTGAIFSLVIHAWIGLWCVLTDYVTVRVLGPRGNLLRGLASLACGLALFIYLVWGMQILWLN